MTLEITRMLDEDRASPEAIDDSIIYGLALRRTTMGALMQAAVEETPLSPPET